MILTYTSFPRWKYTFDHHPYVQMSKPFESNFGTMEDWLEVWEIFQFEDCDEMGLVPFFHVENGKSTCAH